MNNDEIENYKDITTNTYNNCYLDYEEKSKKSNPIVRKEFVFFRRELNGTKLLDLGSGPGNFSYFFKEKGYDILCFDISSKMIKRCLEKGMRGYVGDIENIDLNETFDGIIAYASLLHIPKSKIKNVIDKIHSLLNEKGIIGIAMKLGSGENIINTIEGKRFFSYYSVEEIKSLFENKFDEIRFNKFKDNIWITAIYRKK